MACRQDLTVVTKTGKRDGSCGGCPEGSGVLLTCNSIIQAQAGDTFAVSVQIQNTSPDTLLDLNLELRLENINDCSAKPICLSRFSKCPLLCMQSFEIIQDVQINCPGCYRVAGTAVYKMENNACAPSGRRGSNTSLSCPMAQSGCCSQSKRQSSGASARQSFPNAGQAANSMLTYTVDL